MTPTEVLDFLEKNKHIEMKDDTENQQLLFRDKTLPYYQNDPDHSTDIAYWKMDELTVEQLMFEIKNGLQVNQMTRVTGYFSQVRQWNPGKRAELKDRRRMDLTGRTMITQQPVALQETPLPIAATA